MAEAFYRDFGKRVRDARGNRTQQDIAVQVGMSRAAIANIELGRQRVPLHMIARFARALEVPQEALLPTNELLDGEQDSELRRLSDGDRRSVEAVIGSLTRGTDNGSA
ncbi:MAG TPA: helix-turn-helix transcriptional regulator [Candidatus Dormibacteraeota bacterium]|nr:helix-turn-helix transcriptional regulator [Candidatus Dormibacteraeota bacterium]